MALRIYLTGRLALERDGSVIDQDAFAGRQAAVVFARLLLPRGLAVSRDELAAMLWGDALPKAWDVALNAVVSKLRALLAKAGLDKGQVLPSALGCYQMNLPAEAGSTSKPPSILCMRPKGCSGANNIGTRGLRRRWPTTS